MNQKKPKQLTKILILAVTILVVVAASLIFTYNLWGLHPASTPNTSGNRELIHGTAIIDRGYYYLQFTVPHNLINIHVIGNYSAQNNSTIRLYVMDEDSFEQWGTQNKNFSPIFDSGKSTNGDVNATLTHAGVYYVLFENSNPAIQQVVDVELNLTYWQI
jgi:hypothetical protein